jgi:hypothetical protein
MQIFPSDWLNRMILKSSASPEKRILNLFTILQDWLDAPGIREQFLSAPLDHHQELNELLLSLAIDTKLPEPKKLAFQLYLILLGALNEEIRHPGSNAISRASEASVKLIDAARPPRLFKSSAFAMASTILISMIGGALLLQMPAAPGNATPVHLALHRHNPMRPAARPDQLVAIYQMHNQIQAGQCSYPQALMLDANQRAAFLEGVVHIDTLNTTTTDLDEVRRLYQMVDCYYPPLTLAL